jgi:hypothetical protein
MAATPMFKVYRGGAYVASCKHAEDAAAIVGMSGGEVRWGHSPKWRLFVEGSEEVKAEDSWDGAAEIIHYNLQRLMRERQARLRERQRISEAHCAAREAEIAQRPKGGDA